MTTTEGKLCACKGIRTCLFCETSECKSDKSGTTIEKDTYLFCLKCNKAWIEEDFLSHPHHSGVGLPFDGVYILPDFISESEEEETCKSIDQVPFTESQSGRRKQDYGPKVNFKRKKVRIGQFNGLPEFSKKLYNRMRDLEILKDFQPVELCNLDYDPSRGSSIDPHFDDFWIWGERLVTINLLSDSKLSMTNEEQPNIKVLLPLLRRSLIVIYGPARSKWRHAIHRKDITSRRLAVTLRELAADFTPGHPDHAIGQELINSALNFSGSAIGSR